ncbi:UDP-GlcNAc:undecaprenyl-phosphate/decaprenyl-phosphate GlcNAc-1-phosphate transferase [Gammaproteobacteria bacterium]
MEELLGVLVTFGTGILLILSLRPFAKRIGLVDAPGGRKWHGDNTPLVGGIAMFGAFVIAIILNKLYFPGIFGLLVGAFLLVALGAFDDFHELRAWPRIIGQILAAMSMYFLGGRSIESLGALFGASDITLGPLALPFTIFATVGVINAFNMIDGVDGLAGGLSLISLLFFALLASLTAHQTNLMVLATLGTAVLAFLLFNLRLPGRPFALVFMGDAGSMFLGFMLCWFAVDLSQGEHRALAPVTALWILAVPLFDTLSVMIRRMTNKQSPFAADRGHLHHVLMEQLSIPRQTDPSQPIQHDVSGTVIIIFTMAIIFGLIGVILEILGVPEITSCLLFLTIFAGYLWITVHQELLKTILMALRRHSLRNSTAKNSATFTPSTATASSRYSATKNYSSARSNLPVRDDIEDSLGTPTP